MTETQDHATDQARSSSGGTALVHRRLDVVVDATWRAVEGGGYRVLEADRERREMRFTDPSGSTSTTWTYEVGVEEMVEGACLVLTALFPAPGAKPTRGERRAARRTARRVLDQVRSAADQVPTTPQEAETLAALPAAVRPVLAEPTGGRSWLAALVLLAAYAVPLLLACAVVPVARTGWLGDTVWLPVVLALLLGYVPYVWVSVEVGGWTSWLDWGEQYPLTFGPLRGFALGWWRVLLQLAGLVLATFPVGAVEDAATLHQMNDAGTSALPAYAERAPVVEGVERVETTVDQSEYLGRPNAASTVTYHVPTTFTLDDVEAYLRDPAWADGVDGGRPIGALEQVGCSPDAGSCEADVTPVDGGPVLHTVTVELRDYMTVELDDGSEGAVLEVEIEYRAPA